MPQTVLDSLMQDLSRRTGGDLPSISVAASRATTWSDGSLGCPQPGRIYTQALVEGHQVILEVRGQQYDYRTDDRGRFLLCEGGGIPGIGIPGGGEPTPPSR